MSSRAGSYKFWYDICLCASLIITDDFSLQVQVTYATWMQAVGSLLLSLAFLLQQWLNWYVTLATILHLTDTPVFQESPDTPLQSFFVFVPISGMTVASIPRTLLSFVFWGRSFFCVLNMVRFNTPGRCELSPALLVLLPLTLRSS